LNRIRSIKPEIRRNRKIADCGLVATLLSRELITYADDQGRFPASTREIKAECFPYHDDLKLADVEAAILALADIGFIELYVVGDSGTVEYQRPADVQYDRVPKVRARTGREPERFGWMPGWFKHQVLKADRVTWSEFPPPPGFRPETMSKALRARWLQDAETGDLPPRGDGSISSSGGHPGGSEAEPDGSLVPPQGRHVGSDLAPSGSDLEPNRRQTGVASETLGDKAFRSRAGVDRTGPERTGPDRTGPRHAGAETSGSRVEPMPLSPEVQGRVDALSDGCLEVLAARPLKTNERDLVLGWASTLRRGGELVPVDEVLAVVRRKMAVPTPDGDLPANLAWCADDVAALARAPAAATLGAAGEQLTPNSRLARRIEAELRQRQGGAMP
jgi:hypothetical protein